MTYALMVAGILLCVLLAEWFSSRDMEGGVVACGIALLLLVSIAFAMWIDEDRDAHMAERPESVWTELQERTGEIQD